MYYGYYYQNIDFAVAAAAAAVDTIECVIDKVVPVLMTMCSVVAAVGIIAPVLMTMGSVVAVGTIAFVIIATLVAVRFVAAVDVELQALLVVEASAPAAVPVVPSLAVLP
jgi:hypothetical protein